MIADMNALMTASNDVLLRGFMIFPRVAAIMAFLPALGERTIPARIKLVLALCFVAILVPMLQDFPTKVPSGAAWTVFILVETGIGTFLAMVIRLWVLALQTAGAIAAQSTSLSQLFGGAVADPLPALGNAILLAGLTIFVISGLHLRVIEYVHGSFRLFPLGKWPEAALIADWGRDQIARSFALSFMLAFPFVLVAVAYNVMLGAMNRAMPQLMVTLVGAPAISLVTLALMAILLPFIIPFWRDTVAAVIANPEMIPK